MKKGFLKTLVSAATVVSAVALSSVIALAATHTLTADADGVADGDTFDNGYFTAVGSGNYKSSGGTATFELGKKGANYIKFTPEGNGTVTVYFASTGSSNESVIDLCDSDVKSLEQAAATGTTPTEYTFTTEVEVGTTYVIANLGTSRATRLASVVVEEQGAASYPAFNDANTDSYIESDDKSAEATLDAGITDLAEGDTLGSLEDPTDAETIPGFVITGNASETDQTFTGMTIEGNSKTFEGVSYDNRLKTNGIGSVSKYNISFEVAKTSTVEVIGMSGNSSSTRPFVIADADGNVLASHDFVGSTMSKAIFCVPAGTYYMYAVDATAGSNGGVNLYDIKIYDGATYKLPTATLENGGVDADGKLSLVATINGDFDAGQVTAIGFILAKPDATSTSTFECIYYTETADGNFAFTGLVPAQNLKAQAYLTYTSELTGESVTRYSNTVVNVVE